MSEDLSEELVQIKRDRELAQQQADKLRGVYEQTMKEIQREFGYTNLGLAAGHLEQMIKKEKKLREGFEHSLEDYKCKWKAYLNEE